MKISLKYSVLIGTIILVSVLLCLNAYSKSEPINHVFPLAIDGMSMEPTFHDGQFVSYSDNAVPQVGDVITFSCNNDICLQRLKSEGYSVKYGRRDLIKRISSIHDNCYYLIGDNPDHSWDSRDFGELCGDQITIYGVVIDK